MPRLRLYHQVIRAVLVNKILDFMGDMIVMVEIMHGDGNINSNDTNLSSVFHISLEDHQKLQLINQVIVDIKVTVMLGWRL